MTFLQQRERLITGKLFQGISSCYAEMQSSFKSGQWENVITEYRSNTHTLKLSSSSHKMLSMAHLKLGDTKMATQEERQSEYLLTQLLATGNGTLDEPYLICTMSDEQDILRQLGLESFNQKSTRHNGKMLHIIEVENGTEIAFDVTHLQRFIRF
jgi:hypothetical protein